MTLNRSALRRGTATQLLNKIKESTQNKGGAREEDARMWQPTVDQAGNGFAVIRFLPAKAEDGLPYVKQYNQGFKVGQKWFINNCPTTIGLPSPAVEHCNELWDSGFEEDKKIARDRKRKLRYFSNVLIIKDPKNPDAEGQVKIFTYGAKVFEKIQSIIAPPEEFGEDPRDPFSFFDGVNLKLKIKKKDGYRNYDDSTFDPAGDLFGGDEDKLEALFDQMHDIDALNGPDKFKSYDVLKNELAKVLGQELASEDSPVQQKQNVRMDASKSTEYGSTGDEPEAKSKTTRKPAKVEPEPAPADADDDLSMFTDLMADD